MALAFAPPDWFTLEWLYWSTLYFWIVFDLLVLLLFLCDLAKVVMRRGNYANLDPLVVFGMLLAVAVTSAFLALFGLSWQYPPPFLPDQLIRSVGSRLCFLWIDIWFFVLWIRLRDGLARWHDNARCRQREGNIRDAFSRFLDWRD